MDTAQATARAPVDALGTQEKKLMQSNDGETGPVPTPPSPALWSHDSPWRINVAIADSRFPARYGPGSSNPGLRAEYERG